MLRLAVRVHRAEAELVLAELLELAPGGVEESELPGDIVEYAVYGAAGELPALPDLKAAAGTALVEVSTSEVADDWSERWREFHRPLVLDGALTVRPPWESPGATPIDLVIDPGQAFGTGAHATTRLCLELMLELAGTEGGSSALGPLLDLGCGSGVLAIASVKLGWEPVEALDNDPASVVAAGENAERNGVVITVRRHDLRSDPVPTAPTVTANLLGPLLRSLAGRLLDQIELPSALIASGLLTTEADEIAAAFARSGLHEITRRHAGEWSALLLKRDPRG
jgi:ribosomal protein L11 methyltransferase